MFVASVTHAGSALRGPVPTTTRADRAADRPAVEEILLSRDEMENVAWPGRRTRIHARQADRTEYEIRPGCDRTVQRERPPGRVALRPRSRCSRKGSSRPPTSSVPRCEVVANARLRRQVWFHSHWSSLQSCVRCAGHSLSRAASIDDESPVIPRRTEPGLQEGSPDAGPGAARHVRRQDDVGRIAFPLAAILSTSWSAG